MTTTHIGDVLADAMDSNTTATGYAELDQILMGGIRPGQLVIIGGRTGVGKTTFATDLIRTAAIQKDRPTLIFTPAESAEMFTMRLMCAEADVMLNRALTGRMPDQDWMALTKAITRVENAPIILDSKCHTIDALMEQAWAESADTDLGLIVVDDLNLISTSARYDSRQQEIAEVSRELKILARSLNVPVVATSQLRRGIEERGDDVLPHLWDLRGSGTLEQDADIVIFVNRPDLTNRDHPRAGEADLIVAKNRLGAVGTVQLAHMLHRGKFAELPWREGDEGASQ